MDALYQLSYDGVSVSKKNGTGGRTRTYEAKKREIYSLLSLPLDDSGISWLLIWSRFSDSNRGPTVYKTVALTN